MRYLPAFLLLTLILAAASPARGLGLTVYCEYPPPSIAGGPGSKSGLIYEQVREMMRRADVSGPIEHVSWKRGYAEATTTPDVGLFPATRTKEREDLFHWIGPILRVTWAFYSLKGSGIVIHSLDNARQVGSIGTYANDVREQWLKANGFNNLVSVMDNQTNLRKLYEGRIDLMVGAPPVTDGWPRMLGYDPNLLVMAYKFKTVDLYLALSEDTNLETVRALRDAFSSMIKDGTVRKIYGKWAPATDPPVGE